MKNHSAKRGGGCARVLVTASVIDSFKSKIGILSRYFRRVVKMHMVPGSSQRVSIFFYPSIYQSTYILRGRPEMTSLWPY